MKKTAIITTAKVSLAAIAISFAMSSCSSSTAAHKGRHLCPAYGKVDTKAVDVHAQATTTSEDQVTI